MRDPHPEGLYEDRTPSGVFYPKRKDMKKETQAVIDKILDDLLDNKLIGVCIVIVSPQSDTTCLVEGFMDANFLSGETADAVIDIVKKELEENVKERASQFQEFRSEFDQDSQRN
jgi:hypothetical protein